jgi:PAS domain S-box-containing protein
LERKLQLRIFTFFTGAFALVGGALTLAGWALDLVRLTDWMGVGISMLPNAAACSMGAGAALVLVTLQAPRSSVLGLGILVALLGGGTLSQYATGLDLGIDRLLLFREWGQAGTAVPGRMGLPGSISWMLLGASLALMTGGVRSRRTALTAAVVVVGIATLSLVGYFFGAKSLFAHPRLTTIALQTTTLILAVAAGVVATLPGHEPLRTLLGGTISSMLAKRAVPLAVLVPLLVGWLQIRGQEAGYFDMASGTALRTFIEIILLVALVWWALRSFARTEDALMRSEEQLQMALAASRRSEARFRAAVSAVSSLVWTNNARGEMVDEQPGWASFTGQSIEEYQRHGWTQAVHADDVQPTLDAWHQAVAEKRPFRFEHRLRRHDGEWRVCSIRAVPVLDEDRQLIEWVGVHTDITEQREAEIALHKNEEELREAKERAEAASSAKDNFLAQLSHELRTPLTPVLMTAAALREDDRLPPDVRSELAMVERNVQLEARLIEDLLDLTRITQGKLTLRNELCDAHALIALSVEMIRDEAGAKRVTVELNLAATRPHLTGDPARLQQIFWNLLRNAIKFTPTGGQVHVSSFDGMCEPGTGGTRHRVCIAVSDDGIGFNPSEAEKLFEPFHQCRAQSSEGLGLGLAIAKAIVDLHSGRIHAESDGPGCGATFTVDLPAEESRPANERTTPAEIGTSDLEPSLRLLVVEDHEPTSVVLSRLLTRAGHHVTLATTVAGALATAHSQTFDFVVSDLGLPDGTGHDVMEQLRDLYGLRGIALSGYGMEEDLRRSEQAGFVAHLIKPVNVNELRHALRRFNVPSTM